jgi:nitroreductase
MPRAALRPLKSSLHAQRQFHQQPWRFAVVRNPDLRRRIGAEYQHARLGSPKHQAHRLLRKTASAQHFTAPGASAPTAEVGWSGVRFSLQGSAFCSVTH